MDNAQTIEKAANEKAIVGILKKALTLLLVGIWVILLSSRRFYHKKRTNQWIIYPNVAALVFTAAGNTMSSLKFTWY